MALITTTSQVPTNLQGYYDRNLLERLVPITLHDKFADMRPLPKNMGDRINMRRYESLPVSTTRLTEGTTPEGLQLSPTDIYATLYQYGNYVITTDWLQMTGLDKNILEITGDVLSELAAQMYDQIIRDVIVAGTNVKYEGTATSRDTVDGPITDEDVNYVIRLLEGNNARPITSMKTGSVNVGTVPIAACYPVICHPHARYDIENLTGFIPVQEYANQDALSKAQGEVIEIGSVKQLRFLATTNAKVWLADGAAVGATGMKADDATNIDVYASLVLAKKAYSIVPLQSKNIKTIVKQLGSSGVNDALDQRASVGFKFATTAKITQEDAMVRIEHAVTAIS